METGICVKVNQKLDSNGNRVCTAIHRRDSTTVYRLRLQTSNPIEALNAWILKFTGSKIGQPGLIADFKLVARGSDHEGYYYILSPTSYN